MDRDLKMEREQALIAEMIALYCRKNHKTKTLCSDCAELSAYSKERVYRCPHMDSKTFCSNCETHCYSAAMRERIREVMRFSGPRIIFTHPVTSIRHAYYSLRKKK